MDLSIIIPARDEEKNIVNTVQGIEEELTREHIDYEIVVINDGSTDTTADVVTQVMAQNPRVRLVHNTGQNGIGNAIRVGLHSSQGRYIIIAMADASDDPKDMVAYYRSVQDGYDCCFGNRWDKTSVVKNYPKHKLFLNRFVNWCLSVLFQIKYKDITNAFKCYSRETIDGIMPILSHHFNITVELPLKAIVRGYRYKVIPSNWYNRQVGVSSLKLKEMGSRYLFITLYIFLEKLLCARDYQRKIKND
jgi:dolichol-phosphate mannosyltransferase